MRILSIAVIAALFTAGSFAAHAQDAAPAPAPAKTAKVKCRKRAEADCKAPDCTWTPGADASKPGKCSKATKAK
ncbi:MAG: hypothetical protein ACLP7P_13165 [Rhodomicrobium sp.]